jgi:hypothetical protein
MSQKHGMQVGLAREPAESKARLMNQEGVSNAVRDVIYPALPPWEV